MLQGTVLLQGATIRYYYKVLLQGASGIVLVVVVAHGSGSACAGASAHALFALVGLLTLESKLT